MRSKVRGFTLIELVVVIVILGILAATALPKFVNLGGDARVAVMEAVEGSMRSANSMLYAKAVTASQEALAAGTVTVNGAAVATVYGYAKDATELAKLLDLDSKIQVDATKLLVQHTGAVTKTTCQVAYTAATNQNTPPAYTRTTSDCS